MINISLHIQKLPPATLGGGGGTLEPNSRTGVFWRIWTQIYCLRSTVQKPASLSHTRYVETNENLFVFRFYDQITFKIFIHRRSIIHLNAKNHVAVYIRNLACCTITNYYNHLPLFCLYVISRS